MKDIAKMREEMERKIKEAELENEFEQKTGISCFVSFDCATQKGKTWINFRDVTKEQARKLLKEFPWTERAKRTKSASDSSVLEMSYLLETHRYPKEYQTKLEVEWIHDDYLISFYLPIDRNDTELMAYFREDKYSIDDSTIGLYFGCVSSRERELLSRQPVLSFNCGSQIRYSGGYFLQTSEGHAECIVAEIIGE